MQSDLNVKPFTTAGAYAAKTLVYLSAAGVVTQLADQTKPPLGVLQSASTATNLVADVAIPEDGQFVELTAAAAVTAGKLQMASTGGAITNCASGGSDDKWSIGVAHSTGTIGATVTVLWRPVVINVSSGLGGN
jgi:hypothetical protein